MSRYMNLIGLKAKKAFLESVNTKKPAVSTAVVITSAGPH